MREGQDAVLARPCVPCPGYSSTPGCLFGLYGATLPSSTIRPRRRGQMSLTPDPADPFVIGLGGRESEIGQQRGNVRGLGGGNGPPPATAFFRGTLRGLAMCRGQLSLLGAVKIAATTREIAASGFGKKWASGDWLERGYFYGQPAATTCTKALALQLRGSLLPS